MPVFLKLRPREEEGYLLINMCFLGLQLVTLYDKIFEMTIRKCDRNIKNLLNFHGRIDKQTSKR